MNLCDCNGKRIPVKWKVTASGVTNGTCGSCGSVNGDYYLERVGTSCFGFSVTISSGPCGLSRVDVAIEELPTGLFTVNVYFVFGGDFTHLQVSSVVDLLAGPIHVGALFNWAELHISKRGYAAGVGAAD